MNFQTSSNRSKSKFYFTRGKRILDLVLTIPVLIALSPVLVLIAILVRIRLGSPILFKQIRPGLHEEPFAIFKFRTMTNTCMPSAHYLTVERLVKNPQFYLFQQSAFARVWNDQRLRMQVRLF